MVQIVTSEWFRSSDDVRAGFAAGNFGLKAVSYSAIDGIAIFEGDIALGSVEQMEALAAEAPAVEDADRKGLVVVDAQNPSRYRWPGGEIPFEFDQAIPQLLRLKVFQAMALWKQPTAVRFTKRTPDNEHLYPNYICFVVRDGCWSHVGMQGGRQEISLTVDCPIGAALHELGHAIGLWHEQSREDRQEHIDIIWNNIDQTNRHNFEQHITDGDDVGPYDYESIMHYGPMAFSRDQTHPTIISKKPGKLIGQREKLSVGDIAAVKLLYL